MAATHYVVGVLLLALVVSGQEGKFSLAYIGRLDAVTFFQAPIME